MNESKTTLFLKAVISIILIFLSVFSAKGQQPMEDEFRKITQSLSTPQFENIKSFILEHGDRRTYCNKYNDNPHYAFDGFDVYLNPEIGQANINCDPEISDFNELVIHDPDSEPQYYTIMIIRKGDFGNEDNYYTYIGMQEDNTYLMRYYDNDPDAMFADVQGYLSVMKERVKSH